MTTPTKSGHVLARCDASGGASDDVYGTFAARQRAVGAPRAAHSSSTSFRALLRAAGVTGVLLLAASCLTSRASEPSIQIRAIADDVKSDDVDVITETIDATKVAAEADTIEAVDAVGDIEKTYLDSIDPERIREFLHHLSSVPHISGSPGDYDTAIYTLRQFESFGLKAEIKEYYTLLSTPVRRHLSILKPVHAARELNWTEGSIAGDSCTTNTDAEPPFLAYSPSGNVTASVVYANYGTQSDFQWLVDHNVTLKGKIALMRYGAVFRGVKALVAWEHGMAGALIYSDPLDDGFLVGPVYPDGPWRPEDSFQRGSIYNDCGDPLTPGYPSVLGCDYIDYEDATGIPKIPSLPLSYGQAKHILKALGGKKAPETWQGGLTFPTGYHVGDDESTVLNLDLEMDNKIGPIWDVVATIEGAEEPNRQVILGNHRDAWVCGAIDPNSGSSTMLEVARVFGELLKQGWRPRRTIKLASWDAEEQGLLGSTEYAEDLADSLKAEAIAYLNVDGVLGDVISPGGTPSIAQCMYDAAKSIPSNKFGSGGEESTLHEQWMNQAAASKLGSGLGTLGPDHLLGVLGTSSDFGAYTHHLGIVSSNINFVLKGGHYGTYHSTMDSIMYSELYADPLYATHVTTAQWWGIMALRLADSKVLPFDFSTYSTVMNEALDEYEPQLAAIGHKIDFTELRDAINQFNEYATTFHKRLARFESGRSRENPIQLRYWNDKLTFLERHLTFEKGLPHRGWYKHVVFGPGFYDVYGGTAFPGLADGIAFKDNTSAIQAHVNDVVAVVQDAAAFLLPA